MAVSRESAVIIERRPLDTSPAARLNSYNHHALAPWLEETGYLTPLFLHKRKKEIAPCNMGPWLSPAIRLHMLHPPVAVHRLSQTEVVALLEVASEVQHDVTKAESIDRLQSLACRINETMGGFGKNPPPPRRADEVPDGQLFFFPYHTDLDRLSEWRCYINKHRVVAISQSRFYHCNHPGITDDALRCLAMHVRRLWAEMAPQLRFDSCVPDVYAEVKNPNFLVNLIEINSWGAHAGSGSLLFHWLDDADILNRMGSGPEPAVVIRLVEEGESPVLSRDEAYRIGRERIIEDELRCLRERGVEWILGDDAHAKFMELSLPAAYSRPTTRKHGLEMFRRKRAVDDRIGDGKRSAARDHPRFVQLKWASSQG
ncbi:hypothetical protein CGCF413_v007611 [Colletotrichum fructicola]|nr:hypothetical protein CGCF413_v007611 [Colletotrichum fructicola]